MRYDKKSTTNLNENLQTFGFNSEHNIKTPKFSAYQHPCGSFQP